MALLAAPPLQAQSGGSPREQAAAHEETLDESEREAVIQRKQILMAFPLTVVGIVVVALVVTRRKRRGRRND